MAEHERQLEILRGEVVALIDDHVVSAQWCARAGRFGDDGLRAIKAIRRWTARGDHPADRAPGWNILALTPTRLVVCSGRYVKRLPPVEPKDVLASWPLGQVELTSRRIKRRSPAPTPARVSRARFRGSAVSPSCRSAIR